MKSIADVIKHKFMVQATATELQSSENYKLSQFWETKGQDKANLQSLVLKINMLDGAIGNVSGGRAGTEGERQTTVVNHPSGGIGYEDQGKRQVGQYEAAPQDSINEGNSDELQRLTKLQNEIKTMQAEIDGIMKKHTEDGN